MSSAITCEKELSVRRPVSRILFRLWDEPFFQPPKLRFVFLYRLLHPIGITIFLAPSRASEVTQPSRDRLLFLVLLTNVGWGGLYVLHEI